MYRLLAIAKYDERYVIPPAHAEQAHSLEELATECSLDYEGGPGMGGSGPFGEGSGAPTPIAVENFQMLQDRQTADTMAGARGQGCAGQPAQLGRQGRPDGLFPPRRARAATTSTDTARRRDRDDAGHRSDLRSAGPSPAAPHRRGSPRRCCSTTPTRRCSAGCR